MRTPVSQNTLVCHPKLPIPSTSPPSPSDFRCPCRFKANATVYRDKMYVYGGYGNPQSDLSPPSLPEWFLDEVLEYVCGASGPDPVALGGGVMGSVERESRASSPPTPGGGCSVSGGGATRQWGHIPHSPGTPTTGLRERRNDTSGSTGRSGRQNAATRRNMRRDERVTVHGPVKEQQNPTECHTGGGGGLAQGLGI